MSITCPYCQAKQSEVKPAGELMRCSSCKKVFEVSEPQAPLRRRSPSSPKKPETPEKKPTTSFGASEPVHHEPIRHKKKMDLDATKFRTELLIANLVTYFAYFVCVCSVGLLLLSWFTGRNFYAALSLAAMILGTGIALLLGTVVAKATMKTADYLRIIAEHLDS